MDEARLNELVGQMTLEEKAQMCAGRDFWWLQAVERLGIPSVMVSDGPHGLRKQAGETDNLGLNESIKAVCFPTAAGTACSFDRELLYTLGRALGEECQAENVSVLLGPAANIKRSPLCGRNFEYFSEDPYLSAQMAASHIKGVQSQGVGTSLKHFAANNQEHLRMSISAEIDERTLREIYLGSFEDAVKEGEPWTVMCSYNRINGVYSSENPWLLTDVLRGEWGFEGYVMTDWGACNDRVAGLKAGLELEMPGPGGVNDEAIVRAVREGTLEEAVLDRAVGRILRITQRYIENRREGVPFDREAHHALARQIARESMVLLKNSGVLPLNKGQRVAFLGEFAENPRYQGGGSSHINASRITSALQAAAGLPVTYHRGYRTDSEESDEALLAEAVAAAREAEAAVIFAGLPAAYESEGYDRTHLAMPACQNALIEAVCRVQPNTVVVLHNGAPVEMPWIERVAAVLEAYLGGQAVGGATVDLLYGDFNPCGKLAETFPLRLQDTPAYLFFPGDGENVEYREGIYVGYRYYDSKEQPVLFPFGHGLSYTTFAYSDLRLSAPRIRDTGTLEVSLTVKNTGPVAGKEVVQLYVRDCTGTAPRPDKELRGFEKVYLEPGEEKRVTIALGRRAFAYYSTALPGWHVGAGEYQILVGRSSRDIALQASVLVDSEPLPLRVTDTTTVGELLDCEKARPVVERLLRHYAQDHGESGLGEGTTAMMDEMLRSMPLHSLRSFCDGKVDNAMVAAAISELQTLFAN